MNAINAINLWWQKLTLREQRLLFVAAISLLVAILYWGITLPVIEKHKQAQEIKQREHELLAWVSDKANTIVQLRNIEGRVSEQVKPINNASANQASPLSHLSPLNQIVSLSTRRFQIELIRMQPVNQTLQVWIKPPPFNQFIQWLEHLRSSEGVDVEVMDVSSSEQPGIIEVKRLLLKRV